jgi:hypothetical protein
MTSNVPAPLFDAPKILEQYLAGKNTKMVAEELGTRPEKLVYWLSKNAEEDWKAAQFLKAIQRKDKADEQIEKAEDLFQLRAGGDDAEVGPVGPGASVPANLW